MSAMFDDLFPGPGPQSNPFLEIGVYDLDSIDHRARARYDVASSMGALRSPKRVSVSMGAAESLMIKQPGQEGMYWSAEETPYMVEPIDMLASRIHEAVCFVGPARSGKTVGFTDAWMAHNVVNDPGDMAIIQMSQEKAREFSKTRVDRALRYSPKLQALKSTSAHMDNTHDKMFRHGMMLRIGWPTVTNLSGSEYRYITVPDYDRTPDDVEGEGSKFQLALKRTQTFLSRGMCAVESSPGRPLVDPKWTPATKHEAPPTGGKDGSGILGIYNISDRRRWHWKCLDCKHWYEAKPGLELFKLPTFEELVADVRKMDVDVIAAEFAYVHCPHCGSRVEHKWKQQMNAYSTKLGWWGENQTRNKFDELRGEPGSSLIAGFWLGGVAANYQTWKSIIQRYLNGLRDYVTTESEQGLQTSANLDQGVPYMSQHLVSEKVNANDPKERKDDGMPRYVIPEWCRTLIASCDVQGGKNGRFEIQVHGFGEFGEQAIVDRFHINKSMRLGMGEEYAPLDPAAFQEDWDVLTEQVLRITYRTSHAGLEFPVKLLVIDTGGEHIGPQEGVSEKAYNYWRGLRQISLQHRVMLTKGNNTKTDWVIKETRVGKRHGKDSGDVSLYLLNVNILKDQVSAGVKRTTPGPGYIHFPGWFPEAAFDELNAEVRHPDGTWHKVRRRNETLDLCVMIRAGYMRLGIDKIVNYSTPPAWLQVIGPGHPEVITSEQRRLMQANKPVPIERATGQPRERRSSRSSYIR